MKASPPGLRLDPRNGTGGPRAHRRPERSEEVVSGLRPDRREEVVSGLRPDAGPGLRGRRSLRGVSPPPLETNAPGEHDVLRAVVFVTEETTEGTDRIHDGCRDTRSFHSQRSPQEYADPLLVLTGETYAALSFDDLHRRLCDALRGDRA